MYTVQENMKILTQSLNDPIRNVIKVKNIEKETAGNNGKRIMLYKKVEKKLKTS